MNESKIKPQDLRIGNWVLFRHLDYVNMMEVTCIDQKHIAARLKGNVASSTWFYTEIEPIPLTDELMQKLGFSKQEKYGCFVCTDYSNVEVVIAKEPLYTNACVVVNDYRTQPCIHCRFLHELQNCYFAIVGEELDVKL